METWKGTILLFGGLLAAIILIGQLRHFSWRVRTGRDRKSRREMRRDAKQVLEATLAARLSPRRPVRRNGRARR